MSKLNNRRIDDWKRTHATDEQFGMLGDLTLMNLEVICEQVRLAYGDLPDDEFDLALANVQDDKDTIKSAWEAFTSEQS